jgi:hypothetical protein
VKNSQAKNLPPPGKFFLSEESSSEEPFGEELSGEEFPSEECSANPFSQLSSAAYVSKVLT